MTKKNNCMCNVGTTDKVIRVIVGAAALVAGYYYQSWWGMLGLIPLVTAAFSFCPLYSLLGIKTCRCDTAGEGQKGSCCGS